MRTFALATLADTNGVIVSIENPASSVLWHTKWCTTWVKNTGAVRWNLDQCMFGEPYKKPTSIFASPALNLAMVARKCTKDHEHVKLSGWKAFPGQVCIPTKRCSSTYGVALCEAWTHAVVQHFKSKL